MKITDKSVGDEQGLGKGRGCIDQVFAVKILVEKYLWEVLRIYGVGGKLLSAMKSFYEAASACVKINGETREHFDIKVGLRQFSFSND